MVRTFETRDGQTATDGAVVALRLCKGSAETGDYSEYVATGTLRAFDHVDRVFDDEGYAIDKIVTPCWEILTGDPNYPAIGFLPENVLRTEE